MAITASTSTDIPLASRSPNQGVVDFTLALPKDRPPRGEKLHRVSVRFTAPGYASFTYTNVPVVAGVGRILTPLLTDVAQVDDIGAPPPSTLHERISEPLITTRPMSGNAGDGSAPSVTTGSCTGARGDVVPQTIRVYQNAGYNWYTPDGNIHTYDFKFYVKHVISREMGAVRPDGSGQAWQTEALRANAMAEKMYGWHRTYYYHGGSTGQGCYDVDTSTTYQVFDPY